tara:strand:- start:5213 stop:6658 length:1446 start_codon:yes stop_codon:yes gene_type:complete
MNIFSHLQSITKTSPKKIAITDGDRSFTYADLTTQTQQLAQGFIEQGVAPGDRVVFFLLDSYEEVLCYLASFYCGAIAIPLYENLRGEDLRYMLDQVEPTLIMTSGDLIEHIQPITKAPIFISVEALFAEPKTPMNDEIDTTALISFTSGSTAKPKGVMHTQRHIIENCLATQQHFKLDDDVVAQCSSLDFNASFCSILLTVIFVGGTVVIAQSHDADRKLNEIIEHSVTFMFCVPNNCYHLIQAATQRATIKHKLQYCLIGGDASSPELFEHFHQVFGFNLTAGMGMTETLFQCCAPAGDITHIGSAGQPIGDVKFKIIDDNGDKLPANEKGELLIHSPSLTSGYWQNSEATNTAIKAGWLHSGDIGYLDNDNYFYFLDRKKNIIVVEGDNVTPSEVETILRAHPAIAQVAVIGKPTHKETEAVWAYVNLTPNTTVTEIELIEYASQQLADFKVPTHIVILDQLPTNARGKIDRLALKSK